VLNVVQEESEPNNQTPAAVGGSLLDELVRDGARQMLAAALQAEVAAYVEAHREVVDGQGRRLVVRNGYHEPREVATAAGAVPVRQPRVNDKRTDEATGERQLLGDPAGLGQEVAGRRGGAAAAVPARPVQR
jgi:putative transposase